MNDELGTKIRSVRGTVEDNSERIKYLVDQVVHLYNKDLDEFMEEVRESLNQKSKLSNTEIENITMRVPVYMYFSANGVEDIGVLLDNAKATKMERYNNVFSDAVGTISDKEAISELATLPEHLLVVVYERAYKKLKTKLDVCEQLCQASRKVLHKRINDIDIARIEPALREVKGYEHED